MINKIIAEKVCNSIMLANDDFLHLMVIQRKLQKHFSTCPENHIHCNGAHWTTFTNPTDAILFYKNKIQEGKGRIIILMDYDMGDKSWNGAQLTAELLKIDPRAIIIANSNSTEYNAEILAAGGKYVGRKDEIQITKVIKEIVGCPHPHMFEETPDAK